MTYAEIKCHLWELLTAADKRKGKRTSRFGWLAFLVALPAGAVLGGILAASLNFGDTAGIWSVLLGAAAATLGAAMHAVRKDEKQAAELAVRFKSLFPEANGDFQTAVKLLRQFETDSKVEKDLLKALGAEIKFKDGPVPAPEPKPGPVFKAMPPHGIFSQLPPASSIKSIDDLFALLEKDPSFSGKITKSSKKFGNGGYTTVKVVSGVSGKADPATTAATDGLLGAFENKETATSPAKPESEAPAGPAAEPAPQFIPLDPYERPEDGDADAETEPAEAGKTRAKHERR